MIKYFFVLLLLSFNKSFALQSDGITKNLEVKLEKVLKEHFNESFKQKEILILDADIKQLAKLNHVDDLIFKIKDLNATTIGFAYVGKARSKIALFDYVVIFDKNLVISQVKVLIYRESHGGEIGSKRFLHQFFGFEKNKEIIYKKDIAGISGATISAVSITNSVNNVLKTMGTLYQLKQL